MERRLGRGLGALLGGANTSDAAVTTKDTASGGHVEPAKLVDTQELNVSEILPNSQQPRVRFDTAALESLRDSIKQHGVIQAIAVRKSAEGYELISGERRLKAAKMAGLSKASQQIDMLGKVVRSGLSVRQVEQAVKSQNAGAKGAVASPSVATPSSVKAGRREPWISDVEARLREALGTQVTLEHRKEGQGQISIKYFDTPELERLLSALAPRRPI